MNEIKDIPNEKNDKGNTLGLSDTVRRYSKAVLFSVGLITGFQFGQTVAGTQSLDFMPINSQQDSKGNCHDNGLSNTYLSTQDLVYFFLEQDVGTVKTIIQKRKDLCKKSGEKFDLQKLTDFLEKGEDSIIKYFLDEKSNSKGFGEFPINMDTMSSQKMLDTMNNYIIPFLIMKYGENYMDIINTETVNGGKYNLIIRYNKVDGKLTLTGLNFAENKDQQKKTN